MPSFVYSAATIEQLDDVEGYAPSVQPVGANRAVPVLIAQLHSKMSHKPTLVELVKQQHRPSRQQSVTPSSLIVKAPAHKESVNAELSLPNVLRRTLRWSPSPSHTRDSLALSFFVSVLLFCSLCVDQFAITQVALDASSQLVANPSSAPTANTLGAFTFCRAGTWTSTNEADATLYTFVPDHHCSRIGGECEADGWSLGLMLGRSDSVSCGLFELFRAYLLIAFFCSVSAVGMGVVYVRRPRLSPVFAVVVVFVMLAVTIATLISGCVLQSILPSSATHSHSFWLAIAALLLSVPSSALFTHSEYKRLYRSSTSPPDAIHSNVPPVRLTEGDDDVDERWERQRHEVSQSTYTLDDDHGALLAIEEAAQQPTNSGDQKESTPHIASTPTSALYSRRKTVTFITSKEAVRGEPTDSGEDGGEREVSVSRIDMQQAEWDEEAEEARMEEGDTAMRQRTDCRAEFSEQEQEPKPTSK